MFEAMGGPDLDRSHLYCDKRFCDGFHPIDAGQNMMAKTVLEKVIDFYQKNPKGRQGSK